jgi:tRNA(fMet)-specific endonuclease VapC
VTYLLDTNACIALINARPEQVRQRLESALSNEDEAATSPIVLFELWYGVSKSARPAENAARLNTFLAGPIDRFDFDEEDAREAVAIRAQLEAIGRPIGAYDLLIAGQARRRGATLVTANAAEFARVQELKWEDWASSSAP